MTTLCGRPIVRCLKLCGFIAPVKWAGEAEGSHAGRFGKERFGLWVASQVLAAWLSGSYFLHSFFPPVLFPFLSWCGSGVCQSNLASISVGGIWEWGQELHRTEAAEGGDPVSRRLWPEPSLLGLLPETWRGLCWAPHKQENSVVVFSH